MKTPITFTVPSSDLKSSSLLPKDQDSYKKIVEVRKQNESKSKKGE